ncbi:MAG: N-acetylmuramoyl-L-alanine amidase [Clostridia bacterium]|nr:N-acetylmuramoyl-L-alanine amidase [Clostridia bacterium]
MFYRNSFRAWFLFFVRFSVFSCFLLAAVLWAGNLLLTGDRSVSEVSDGYVNYTVVIDAGHGGRDGGASASDGTLEKHLNLAVALKLKALLESADIRVVMTRESDIELASPDSPHKKLDDLSARVKIAEAEENAVFVSIHMNQFPVEKYSGLQVYYSRNNAQSLTLAETIQKGALSSFPEMPERKVKPAEDIYLMEHLQIPAVLVECGFLSNHAETALLKTEAYQKKLAMRIYASLLDYFSEQTML